MKLKNVAKYFNTTVCRDAYTGGFLFNGQLDVYSEGVRDGVTVQRRVLEVAPGTLVPTRRAIEFGGDYWLMGTDNFDIWKGEHIRDKYALHKASGLAQVQPLTAFFNGALPLKAYAGGVWIKTAKQIDEDSEEFNQSAVYFARGEDVQPNQIVYLEGRYHHVREVYPSTAGHQAALVETIEEPFQGTLVVESAGLDPRTELPIAGANYPALRLRWQSDFRYLSQITPKFETGDTQLVIAAANNVKPGALVSFDGDKYIVVNSQIQRGVRYVHARYRA